MHVNSVEPVLLVIPAVAELITVAVTVVRDTDKQPTTVSLASA